MANLLAKDLELMFESFVTSYDASCVISMEAQKSFPDPKTMQRATDTFYVKQDYEMQVTQGLDISAATPTDLVERLVPTIFRQPDNIRYDLDAREMRDPQHREMAGKQAAKRLAAEIDKNLYNAVRDNANIVIKKVGAIASRDVAQAEAVLLSRGIGLGEDRKMFFSPFDYTDITENLSGRQFMGDLAKDAYSGSRVPDIAGFKTFRTDTQSVLAAAGVTTGTTVAATTTYQPTSMTGDKPTDNRIMNLTVAGANIANIKNGDAISIAGVNAVHQIDKSDTGQALTLRVISGGGTANLVVSPPICATGAYQNATNAAVAGAAITFLNTASKPVNPFWQQGAVCLDYGRLAFPTGEGANVMTAETKNKVPLIMSYSFNHLTGKTTCRMTTLYAATVRDPAKCGIIIANQI